MKAALCHEFGQPLRVEDVELDSPRIGEVRVRVSATAICHSDLHLLQGDWAGALPVVAGHEAAGVVEELGPDVTAVQAGDRVVVSLLRSCGRCAQCSAGSPHLCEGVFPLDTESRMHDAGATPCSRASKSGPSPNR
jgi:S-(hydroxymethyl)glutathione dehydrogenase/alcohol dehydrogenase